jgi:hypothetical protein
MYLSTAHQAPTIKVHNPKNQSPTIKTAKRNMPAILSGSQAGRKGMPVTGQRIF